MRFLITGSQGQIGYALTQALQPFGQVLAYNRSMFDLSDLDRIEAKINMVQPDVIINAAAYTNVDKAETNEGMAYLINAEAVKRMANTAKKQGALFIQYSTDYVFDGQKEGAYHEDDLTNPLNVYGKSKLAGEVATIESGGEHIILRTAWLYAAQRPNFVNRIIELARRHDQMEVVADQVGQPTWAEDLANATAQIIYLAQLERAQARFKSGLFHLSAEGSVSRYQLAEAILNHHHIQTLKLRAQRIHPTTQAYTTSGAARPANSCLDNTRLLARFGLKLPHWKTGLDSYLTSQVREIRKGNEQHTLLRQMPLPVMMGYQQHTMLQHQ